MPACGWDMAVEPPPVSLSQLRQCILLRVRNAYPTPAVQRTAGTLIGLYSETEFGGTVIIRQRLQNSARYSAVEFGSSPKPAETRVVDDCVGLPFSLHAGPFGRRGRSQGAFSIFGSTSCKPHSSRGKENPLCEGLPGQHTVH